MRKKGIQNMDKRSHFGLKLSDRGPKGRGSSFREFRLIGLWVRVWGPTTNRAAQYSRQYISNCLLIYVHVFYIEECYFTIRSTMKLQFRSLMHSKYPNFQLFYFSSFAFSSFAMSLNYYPFFWYIHIHVSNYIKENHGLSFRARRL